MSGKFSPCGEKIEIQHGYTVDNNGVRVFGEVGKVNVRERIKTAGIGCSLYEMIEKYQKTGDDSFLRAKAGAMSADLTAFPKNLIELHQLKNTCVEDFKKFPVDYRALFNHNIDEYVKAVQDNSVYKITEKYFKDKGIEKPDEPIEPSKGDDVKDE